MRALRSIAAAVCLTLIASTSLGKAEALPRSFVLKGLDGTDLRRDNLIGKVVLVQFWASWCVGCDRTMRMMQLWKQKHRLDVNYVTVSVDDSIADADRFFSDKSPSFQAFKKFSYFDMDAHLATELGVSAVPSTLLISADGKILYRITGHPSVKDLDVLTTLASQAALATN